MSLLINGDFDMKLQIAKSNRQDAEHFLSGNVQNYCLPNYLVQHGYRLLVSAEKKNFEGLEQTICLIASGADSSGAVYNEVAYKIKVLVRDVPNSYLRNKNATQLLVWRSASPKHDRILVGFATMMFKYLLDNHNIMITDEQQTEDGRRFWVRRILEAFEQQDVSVSYIDLNDMGDDLSPRIYMINDDDEFFTDYYGKGWGNDEAHKNRVFVVSKQENL
ncbi:MAG: hypothetical protein ACI8WB_002012 [Phenylobacterium sp.]|jgi:hypothetical protein